ncbi:hypothetical protein Tco_0919328 [Tanacetum coccineum]
MKEEKIGVEGGMKWDKTRKELGCPVILIHLSALHNRKPKIMSAKATSAKKTIYGEATSANEHMSAEKQKPTIMSGACKEMIIYFPPLA